ncbi:hypothetical protein [Pyrinomonas sp.]|uniref:hypothetical protein n=1 Tax=Pyrinomonas sp. TaxID=2080306 RepID=UPI0033338DEE
MKAKTFLLKIFLLFSIPIFPLAIVSAQQRQQRALNQTSPRTAQKSAPADPLLAALPTSDAVMLVNLTRLLNDALPRIYAGDPAKLAKVNAEIDGFRARTGIDPRSFERVAVGARFVNTPSGASKIETVALAHGKFNAGTMLAAGRLAAKGKYREEQHQGRSIYIFTIENQTKLLGLFPARLGEVAVAEIDANTLALGTPSRVRAALIAQQGTGRVDGELVALATRNGNALIGFGGTVPDISSMNVLGNDEVSRAIAAVRQFYGSIDTTAQGFEMLLTARSQSAEQAKYLGDTLAAIKQIGGAMASQLPGNRGRLAQVALGNLNITTRGNEVQLQLQLPQAEVGNLVREL